VSSRLAGSPQGGKSRSASSLRTLVLAAAVLGLSAWGAADLIDQTFVASVRATAAGAEAYRPHEVIVSFGTATATSTAMHAITDAGGRTARRSSDGGHFLVTLDDGLSVPDAVSRFAHMPGVAEAEPNGIARATATTFSPNDRLFFRQWHLKMLNAERTWAIQKGGPEVVVAVLDTGVAYEDRGVFRRAPDWGSTVFVQGYNVFTNDSHANDDNFHGTHVASTIAEATDNAEGAAGLAFGCAIMPVKVLDHDGVGSFFDIAEGIQYAYRDAPKKAKVINLSLAGDTTSTFLSGVIEDAVRSGVVIVAAAGNESRNRVSFPASHPNVIGVGAVDARKQRADYSNAGPELDVVAPGGDVDRDDDHDGRPDGVLQQSFDPDEAELGHYDRFAYFYVSGTSQAAPHVAALAALLIQQGITSPAAVQAAIQSTAEDLGAPGRDNVYGYGLIRPVEALTGLGVNQ
jgi:serine protease